ncbi:MAG: RimK/LysX family protein [Alphaproteobacteria bacterium]
MTVTQRRAGSGKTPLVVGWREWVALEALGLPAIKAKIDTGARTSALHAFYVEPITIDGRTRVRFGIHPLQERTDIEVNCVADAVDHRRVSDSGGHRELRWVIRAPLRIGGESWPIEITLTNRDDMMFRMLIGRTAMPRRLVVDPARSYVLGKPPAIPYRRRSRPHETRTGKRR